MEKVLLTLIYILLMIAIFCIFGARGIVKSKVDIKQQNKYVNIVKGISTIVVILSLTFICFI